MASDKTNQGISHDEFLKKLSREDRQAVVDLSVNREFKFIPSGSWVVNSIIGDGTNDTKKSGGFPRGHVVEIFGDESSGKTTLGICACIQAQALGGHAVYIDFERTFHEKYSRTLGLDLSKEKFTLMQPDHFQHGARLINNALLLKPWIIVVDSVSAMTPREALENDIDQAGRVGLQAQLMSMFLGIITKKIQESETCLMFLNQTRMVISMNKWQSNAGPQEESSGGNALKFYSSLRLKLNTQKIEKISATSLFTGKEEKKAINVQVKVTAIKNKIDTPCKSGPIYIRFGEGIDNIASVIELAVNTNVIKSSGAFYTFRDGDKMLINAHGKEDLRDQLKRDNDLLNKVCSQLVVKEDAEEKELAKNLNQDEKVEEKDEMDALDTVSKAYVEKHKKKKAMKEDAE